MSKKVYEIAKELEMESKELLEKINGMGIVAKSHNSVISEIDAKAITNMVLHNRTKTTETKIVKAPPKSKSGDKDKDVKVAVKPATVATRMTRDKPATKTKAEPKSSTRRATDPFKETVQSKTPMSAQPPAGVPLPKSASVQPPAGIPMPKAASLQDMKEKDEREGAAPPVTETKLPKKEVNMTEPDPKKETTSPKIEAKAKKEPIKEPAKEPTTAVEEKPATVEEMPVVPRGLVIKKRATEIAAEEAAAKKVAAEKAAKAAAEKAAKEAAEGRTPRDSRRPAQGQDSRRPAQGQDGRRPAQGQDGRRPAQGQDARRPAQGQDARRPAQGQDA
ncbi:MAG: translation initiation factor IF-2 N-terminal domain-containing protein, partial [Anaerovoracaceae bacterium]